MERSEAGREGGSDLVVDRKGTAVCLVISISNPFTGVLFMD